MTAPERIWLATSLKGAIADLEAMGSMSDLRVKPVQSVSHAYRAWVPADLYTAQQETIAALVEALEECEAEIDDYIRQEYPSDHPVHERYRQRDFSANPARIALARAKEQA